jgi:hypothetical protein
MCLFRHLLVSPNANEMQRYGHEGCVKRTCRHILLLRHRQAVVAVASFSGALCDRGDMLS